MKWHTALKIGAIWLTVQSLYGADADALVSRHRENQGAGHNARISFSRAYFKATSISFFGTAQKRFEEVVDVAERAHLPRMEAEGFLHLSEIHEQRKELPQALTAVNSAIDQVRLVQEDFALPVYIARKAELEAALGNLWRRDGTAYSSWIDCNGGA